MQYVLHRALIILLHNSTSECTFGKLLHEVLLPGKTKKHKNQKVGDTRFWLIHVIYNVEHHLMC